MTTEYFDKVGLEIVSSREFDRVPDVPDPQGRPSYPTTEFVLKAKGKDEWRVLWIRGSAKALAKAVTTLEHEPNPPEGERDKAEFTMSPVYQNPYVHASIPDLSAEYIEGARKMVAQKYDAYWANPTKVEPCDPSPTPSSEPA